MGKKRTSGSAKSKPKKKAVWAAPSINAIVAGVVNKNKNQKNYIQITGSGFNNPAVVVKLTDSGGVVLDFDVAKVKTATNELIIKAKAKTTVTGKGKKGSFGTDNLAVTVTNPDTQTDTMTVAVPVVNDTP